jgi:hypothetical protein
VQGYVRVRQLFVHNLTGEAPSNWQSLVRPVLKISGKASLTQLLAAFLDWDRALDEGGDRKALIARFKERLAARAYLRTVIEDLEAALGSREESDVSHRRH